MLAETESIHYRGNEFYRYDGNSWELIGSETEQNTFKGVWGASENDVFAVGENGMIYHYDGHQWHDETLTGIDTDLNDIWGSESDNVIAIGDQGKVLHYDGVQWEAVASGSDVNLNAVWGDSAGNVYIVGDGGTILLYDGRACTPMSGGTDRDLTGVWIGESDTVYAVGKGAVFLIYNDGTWRPSDSLAAFTDWPEMRWSIWGSSDRDIYACGQTANSNWFLHYDGSGWDFAAEEVNLITAEMLWGKSADDIFFLEKGGSRIGHFDGSEWISMVPFQNVGYYDVWASERDIFCVGENGTIIHSSRSDDTPPRIISVTPQDGATGVRTGMIEILFSEPVASDLTVSIRDDAGNQVVPVPPSFYTGFSSVQGRVWRWNSGATYTVTVSSQVKDFAGNSMGEDYTWSFTAQEDETWEIEGVWITSDLWIGTQFNTGDRGLFEGRWQLGGEDTTARGDRVIWGYFYASPEDVSWGNENNPDLFVKIWYDRTGSLYISYFHVSVPVYRAPLSALMGAGGLRGMVRCRQLLPKINRMLLPRLA